MKTTGLFTTHVFKLDCPVGQTFKLIPFGDVHRDSNLHADGEWKEFLKRAAEQPNALFLGMGDYLDFMSTGERLAWSNGGFHDTSKDTINNLAEHWVKTIANELSFMRGRLIGMLGGNHYHVFPDGENSDEKLASKLGTRFLGVSSIVRLSIRGRGKGKNSHTYAYDIFAHHGAGGGKLAGSTFNKVEDMIRIVDADLYLMGHDHKLGCIPAGTRLRLYSSNTGELRVIERVPRLGRTGSFLKAYEPGEVSYNVDAARAPTALGWIEIEITPTRARAGGKDEVSLQVRATA